MKPDFIYFLICKKAYISTISLVEKEVREKFFLILSIKRMRGEGLRTEHGVIGCFKGIFVFKGIL